MNERLKRVLEVPHYTILISICQCLFAIPFYVLIALILYIVLEEINKRYHRSYKTLYAIKRTIAIKLFTFTSIRSFVPGFY